MERAPEPELQTPPPDYRSEPGSESQPGSQSGPQSASQAEPHWGGSHWGGSQWHGPGSGPPPWWGPPRRNWRWDQRHARRRPTWLFFRFAGVFGLIALMILGGLALLIFFVVKAAGGDRHTAAQIWLGTCGLLLVVPFVVVRLARRAFRNIAAPLSNLMQASDRVAAGDLSVRVPVAERGEFAELSSSFNHMVEELSLADRRRRNLTADVAHELRTPLQIIQGNLEGLVDGVYQPTPEHLEATLAETKLLARLVEDLRVLSQAEAGQLPMQWEVDRCGRTAERRRYLLQRAGAGCRPSTSSSTPSPPCPRKTPPAHPPCACAAITAGSSRCLATCWPTPSATRLKAAP